EAHLPFDPRQDDKRAIVRFPLFHVLRRHRSTLPGPRTPPAIPPRRVESRVGYRPPITHNVNELAILEHLVEKAHSGPARDLDENPRTPGGAHGSQGVTYSLPSLVRDVFGH